MTYQAKKGRPRATRVAVLGVLAAATIGVGVGYWHVTTAGHTSPAPAAPATATIGALATPSEVPSSSPAATPAASTPAAPVTAVPAAPAPTTRRAASTTSSRPAASTTPVPVKVTRRTPTAAVAPDPVDPHPAPAVGQDSCHAGETWDGTNCVAMQNPDEAIGGARCDDPAQVVVAVRPDGTYQCGPRP